MKKEISRRDFLKGVAVSAAGVTAMGLLGACGTDKPAASQAEGPATAAGTDWLGTEPEISKIAETVETEILVVGAGNGGMACAARAAESGAKVIVIDQAAASNTGRTFMGAIGSKVQKEHDVTIDRNNIVEELSRYASHDCDQKLIQLWADNSGEMMDWATGITEKAGGVMNVEYDLSPEGKYSSYATQHMVGGIDTYLAAEIKYALSVGADIRYEHTLMKLVKTDSAVTGAIVKKADDTYIQINASKGVVVATGGYAGNYDMMCAKQPRTIESCTTAFGSDFNKGDGIKACLWAGAVMTGTPTSMLFDRGLVPPGSKTGMPWASSGFPWSGGSQPSLKVNLDGKRFCNESTPYDFPIHAAQLEKDHMWVQIFDSNYAADFEAYHSIGCARLAPGPGTGFTADGNESGSWAGTDAKIAGYVKSGTMVKADSIEEIAKAYGMPEENLAATVKRYNELAGKGIDEDFGKDSYRLRPVSQAPFYACQYGAWLLCTLDGIQIDTEFNALDKNHAPIEGLYVIGNDAGGYFSGNYPELVVGAAAGRTMTFGYLLGTALAKK